MTNNEIIKHPDAFLVMKVEHAGAEKIVSELKAGDYNDEHFVATDSTHERFTKIYVLDKEDVV